MTRHHLALLAFISAKVGLLLALLAMVDVVSDRILILGVLISFSGIAYLLFGYIFPLAMFGDSFQPQADAVQLVLDSGAEFWRYRAAGMIGSMNFSAPLLRIAGHPAGLLFKPAGCHRFAIPWEDIIEIDLAKCLLWNSVRITHSSSGVSSPIYVHGTLWNSAAEMKTVLAEAANQRVERTSARSTVTQS